MPDFWMHLKNTLGISFDGGRNDYPSLKGGVSGPLAKRITLREPYQRLAALEITSADPESAVNPSVSNYSPVVYMTLSLRQEKRHEVNHVFLGTPPTWSEPGTIFLVSPDEVDSVESDLIEDAPETSMVVGCSSPGKSSMQPRLWFLSIARTPDSCLCLRILTYQGQGLSNLPSGRNAHEHSVISTGPPQLTRKEKEICQGLIGEPIGVKQIDRAQRLDERARLLWTAVYEVNYNVRSYQFGVVRRNDRPKVVAEFNRLNPGWDIGGLEFGEDKAMHYSSDSEEKLAQNPPPPTAEDHIAMNVVRIYTPRTCGLLR
jgi:hypothetical protein